jgi:membrane-bound lytic murein transglycosylase B
MNPFSHAHPAGLAPPHAARRVHAISAFIAIFIIVLSNTALALEAKKAVKKPRATHATKTHTSQGPAYRTRADVMALADDMAARRNLDPAWVRNAIGQAHFMPSVARLVLPPAQPTAKNWAAYRARFVEPIRIRAGARFWQAQQRWLEQAEATYGVPPWLVVGIIGVETLYGQQLGGYRVMDALSTLAFDFPTTHPRAAERQAFFRQELEQFLTLKQRTGLDPLALRGSYAGAMGMPQFMPSSWVRYAVDFDGDGQIDLFNSPADVIGSVAQYFKGFNWQPGMPTHYAVQFDPALHTPEAHEQLLAPDILPTFSVDGLRRRGALPEDAALTHTGPLALVELFNGTQAPSYVLGTENFYAVTRYNWSSYYALAVIELGQAVAREVASAPR